MSVLTPRQFLLAREVRHRCEHVRQHIAAREFATAAEVAADTLRVAREELVDGMPELGEAIESASSAYCHAGLLDKAQMLLEEIVAAGPDILDGDRQRYASVLNDLAVVFVRRGDFDKADLVFHDCLDAKRAAFGATHPSLLGTLADFAQLYEMHERLDEALQAMHEICEILVATAGPDDPDLGVALAQLADIAARTNQHDVAAAAQDRSGQILRLSEDLEKICNEAQSLYAGDRFDEAARLHRIVKIRQPAPQLPPELLDVIGNPFDTLLAYAQELDEQGYAQEQKDDSASAETHYRRALAIVATAQGDHSPTAAALHNNIGEAQRRQGKFAEARASYTKALRALSDSPAEEPEKIEAVKSNLAAVVVREADLWAPPAHSSIEAMTQVMGERGAEYARSLRIRFPVPDDSMSEVDKALVELDSRARFYASFGDMDRAGRLLETAVELAQQTSGDTLETIGRLRASAEHHAQSGQYIVARQRLREALRIEAELETDNTSLFRALSSRYGQILSRLGDHVAASDTLQQCLELAKAELGDDAEEVQNHRQNIAVLQLQAGDVERAAPVVRDLLTRLGDPADCLDPRKTGPLAALAAAVGEYADAERLGLRSLELLEESEGRWHPDYARVESNVAVLYRLMGRLDESERLFRRALESRRASLGRQHRDVAQTAMRLAVLLAGQRRRSEAFELLEEVLAIDRAQSVHILPGSSDQQRQSYVREELAHLDLALSLLVDGLQESNDHVARAFELVLARKAIATESGLVQRELILGERYPELREQLDEVGKLRSTIAAQLLLNQPRRGEEDGLHEAEAALRELEENLSARIPEMALEQRLSGVTRSSLASLIAEDETLLEFVVVRRSDHSDHSREEPQRLPSRYVCFVLAGNPGAPVAFVDLGECAAIDRAVQTLRERISGGSAEDWRASAATVRELAVDPLTNHIPATCRRLLLAPDGDLALLPFAVLPSGERHKVLLDNYELRYLATGRDLLRRSPSVAEFGYALILASPDFDLDVAEVTPAAHGASNNALRKALRDATGGFEALPGTAREAESVAAILSNADVFTEARAVESALTETQSPGILHIATHGFFNPGVDSGPGLGPLASSGLALAGANRWLRKESIPAHAGDGLLTAADAMNLDLRNTQLVVLSACDTGVGRVEIGDGVHGLRRAFRLAGAQTTVMSLWKVPDSETADLMAIFYRTLRNRATPEDALRKAQLQIRRLEPHPRYWAGFVCEGGGRPLPAGLFAADD